MDKRFKEIEEHRKRIAELESQLEEERRQKLVNLHEELGYENRADLIAALQRLNGGGRRTRRTVTPELKAQIEAALRRKKPGAAVSREFGVSMPTVQNIKKRLGLVRSK